MLMKQEMAHNFPLGHNYFEPVGNCSSAKENVDNPNDPRQLF